MDRIFGSVLSYYQYVMDQRDPRVEELPLMSYSPFPILALVFLYIYLVTDAGPKLMDRRQPFECKNPLLLFNLSQILLNGYFVVEALRLIWIPRNLNLLCAEVDYSDDPVAIRVANIVWLYFFTKLLDLLDTVFMVLRKRTQQITFLHVYHHSGMVIVSWVAAKFVPGGYGIFFGTINAFVHVIMYSYYFITALYPQYKNNIWWKRHITELQLVQFVAVAFHGLIHFMNPSCNYPKFITAIFVPQNIFMIIMFWDFYKNSYLVPKAEENKTNVKSK